MTESNYPFWNQTNFRIRSAQLISYLADAGFGKYQSEDGRNASTQIMKNESGVIQLHSLESVKRWIIKDVSNDPELDDETIIEIKDVLVRFTTSTLKGWLESLPRFSSKGFEDTYPIAFFRDGAKDCYIPFKNGVVHITRDGINMYPLEKLIDKGCVWESSIISHNIELAPNQLLNKQSPFSDFVSYAMKRDVKPLSRDNNRKLGTDTSTYKSALESFETSYGYMIHSYNPFDEQKLVVYADVNSTPERTEGGNGKSVAMDSLKYYRKTAFIDGGGFRKSKSDSSRFNFTNVKLDTGFIFINDLNKDFELRQLFSVITEDLTIEYKGKDKIVIPKDKKPKLGVTTNYVITGLGNSFERRQHIVEFGDFFNLAKKKNLYPKDIIGKTLFNHEFIEEDWNDFYNYGFYCVQQYLTKGLRNSQNNNYQRKTLIQTIEGIGGDGTVVDWIDKYLTTTRIAQKHYDIGIQIDELYALFSIDNPDAVSKGWDTSRFKDALFDYVKHLPDYDYNPHLSGNGDTRSLRRWRKGERGLQREYVRITSLKD